MSNTDGGPFLHREEEAVFLSNTEEGRFSTENKERFSFPKPRRAVFPPRTRIGFLIQHRGRAVSLPTTREGFLFQHRGGPFLPRQREEAPPWPSTRCHPLLLRKAPAPPGGPHAQAHLPPQTSFCRSRPGGGGEAAGTGPRTPKRAVRLRFGECGKTGPSAAHRPTPHGKRLEPRSGKRPDAT